MNLTCPSCRRHVLNRRLPDCEFCGEPIPFDRLYSPDELDALEDKAEDREEREALRRSIDRARHRERMRGQDPMPGL